MTDLIKEFTDGLPDEAVEAGVRFIEENIIGGQVICLPNDVNILVETVLRACHKAGHTIQQLQSHIS